ncbi:MAG: alanine dehydrogenase [Acidiferrobacteraceae bacterium]
MRIGIPREIKPMEGRVALVPSAVSELCRAGHEVMVERDAGLLAGYTDKDYRSAGAQTVPGPEDLYAGARLIVKVKEPVPSEYAMLRAEQLLFSYLHLAANPGLAEALCATGLMAVGFETVEHQGRLPLLAPMSDIAGRLATQIGATLLHMPSGGRGILLGGLAGTERGKVVVLGAGEAGGNAVRVAAALGAEVTVFERVRERQQAMYQVGSNVTALSPHDDLVQAAVGQADLVIGAVLIVGARTPRLVSAATVARMRSGSVIVDVAVDQGGCIETTRPTDYTAPVYSVNGVLHFAVTNMPGAVPRTASQALSAVLLPYVLMLAARGNDPAVESGVNVRDGRIVHPAVVAALSSVA